MRNGLLHLHGIVSVTISDRVYTEYEIPYGHAPFATRTITLTDAAGGEFSLTAFIEAGSELEREIMGEAEKAA